MELRHTSLRKTRARSYEHTGHAGVNIKSLYFLLKWMSTKQVDSSKKSFSSACLDRMGFDTIAALKPESAARVRHHRIPVAVFCYQGHWSSFQKEFFRPQFTESVSQLVGPVRDELVSNLAVKVSYSWLRVRAYSSNGPCLTVPTSYPASWFKR
jgi:hypothetical protein